MKQQPADGTSDDDGEGCGTISLDERTNQDLDRDSHQEREYRAKQYDSRDNRELPGAEAAHAVTAVNLSLAIFSAVAVNNASELPSPPGVSFKGPVLQLPAYLRAEALPRSAPVSKHEVSA